MAGLTGRLRPMLAAVFFTLSMVGCAAGTGERAGGYVDDKVLEGRVKTALLNDPAVSGLAVNVETYKGTVQLSGFVNTSEEKQRAAEVARSVEGVQEVRNNITVK